MLVCASWIAGPTGVEPASVCLGDIRRGGGRPPGANGGARRLVAGHGFAHATFGEDCPGGVAERSNAAVLENRGSACTDMRGAAFVPESRHWPAPSGVLMHARCYIGCYKRAAHRIQRPLTAMAEVKTGGVQPRCRRCLRRWRELARFTRPPRRSPVTLPGRRAPNMATNAVAEFPTPPRG